MTQQQQQATSSIKQASQTLTSDDESSSGTTPDSSWYSSELLDRLLDGALVDHHRPGMVRHLAVLDGHDLLEQSRSDRTGLGGWVGGIERDLV